MFGRLFTLALASHLATIGTAAPPIAYLHAHKMGGSTFCKTWKDAGLRAGPRNCCCDFFNWENAVYAANMMESHDYDACAVARSRDFPPPEVLREFVAAWPGHVATTVREPYAQSKSVYERELSYTNSTPETLRIADFLSPDYVSQNMLEYGPYNRDNFMVWSFAGCGYAPGQREKLDGMPRGENVRCPDTLNASHLAAAMDALEAMTHVFVLEDLASLETRLSDFTYGAAEHFPYQPVTNNPYSEFKKESKKLEMPTHAQVEMDAYAATFYPRNQLDVALYEYARSRFGASGARTRG